ncbi:hypothetical protein PHAMO_270241 [Magnetospirillum molischianum DSM 120]|uniref:SGNH hydrolase-type esterase domain-containing protein n=2 Tax=Magnetospirillum molischianum TaxID=1083 RepID=H8FSR2_MAGML|nr:hypothetical protein PHAMO_270241 [Magnetospirillum molischianum DSM 120]
MLGEATEQSVFNFGADGANFDQQFLTLKIWLESGHHPKLVIFEADPESLNPASLHFDTTQFREWALENTQIHDLFLPETFPKKELEAFFARYVLKSSVLANRLPELFRAWTNRNNPGWLCFGLGDCRYRQGSLLMPPRDWTPPAVLSSADYALSAKRQAGFVELVEMAQRHGIKVLLIETPRYDVDDTLGEDTRRQTRTFFCGLTENRPDVVYADLSKINGLDKDPQNYVDAMHLNISGAEAFTSGVIPLVRAMLVGQSTGERCLLP